MTNSDSLIFSSFLPNSKFLTKQICIEIDQAKHTNSRGNPAERTFLFKFFCANSAANRPPCPSYIAKCAHLRKKKDI